VREFDGASTVLPNLFVIGAPKCGTTSLFHWLSEHPDICGSSDKETYYLLDQEYPMRREGYDNYHQSGLAGYSAYFQAWHGEPYRVEATPDYLYQQTALEVISQTEKPQVLVVLRKPSGRVYSLYQFARNNAGTLDLDISFREFVEAGFGDSDLLSRKPILQMAIEQSQYVDYIDKWVASIGRENIHLVLFEELTKAPLECLQQLCMGLNIDASYYEGFDFVAYNRTVAVKSKLLHRIRRRGHSLINRYCAGVVPEWFKSMVYTVYNTINQSSKLIDSTDEELMVIAELDTYFAPYNRRLEELMKVDLSVWTR